MLQRITLEISKEEIEAIIGEAFDKGFHGCLDLKEEVVAELVDRIGRRIVETKHAHYDYHDYRRASVEKEEMFHREMMNSPYVSSLDLERYRRLEHERLMLRDDVLRLDEERRMRSFTMPDLTVQVENGDVRITSNEETQEGQ